MNGTVFSKRTALEAYVDKEDVFLILLIGFGKSLIYVTRLL